MTNFFFKIIKNISSYEQLNNFKNLIQAYDLQHGFCIQIKV